MLWLKASEMLSVLSMRRVVRCELDVMTFSNESEMQSSQTAQMCRINIATSGGDGGGDGGFDAQGCAAN